MWMSFLFCLLTTSQISANGNATTNGSQISANGTSSVGSMISSRVSTSPQSHQHDYRRDLLVVLPVMQGNSDLSDFNLQMLYTKRPVTAIISEQLTNPSNSLQMRSSTFLFDTSTSAFTYPVTTNTFPTVTTPRIVQKQSERIIPTVIPLTRHEESDPLNTNFIFTKTASDVHKSALKYSNLENFEFGQEVNKPPINPKSGLAQTDISLPENKWTSSVESTTKGSSFQMLESVEPLEIIKLLSLKPVSISVSDGIAEHLAVPKMQESTKIPNRFTKQPLPLKRPHKKPQRIKLTPQKISDAELASFPPTTSNLEYIETTVTSTSTPTTTTITPSSTLVITASSSAATRLISNEPVLTSSTPKSENEQYDTVRYSTLFAESTKAFFPLHSLPNQTATIIQATEIKSTSSTPSTNNWSPKTSLLTSPTSPPTFTSESNFNLTTVSTNLIQVMETSPPPEDVEHVKPSDLDSLTKIMDVHFDTKTSLSPLASDNVSSTFMNPSFPADMLTSEMKNMLVSLGLLKSENDTSPVLFATSTTAAFSTVDQQQLFDNLFIQPEPITPTIDPNSYINFKKLPSIDYKQLPVNNDVRNLLSSFGLLPSLKSNYVRDNSMLMRTSRQQKDNSSDSSMEMLDGNMRKMLENLGLLKSFAYQDQQRKNEHVFQPSILLEKLADPLQVEKINNALTKVRNFSKSKDTQNLTVEELEQKLRNVTTLLYDETILDANAMDTAAELVTNTSATARTFILNDTTTSQELTSSVTVTNSYLTTPFKSMVTIPRLKISTTTASSVVNVRNSTSTNSGKNSKNNYTRRSSSKITTTTGTTTSSTAMPTIKSSSTSTIANFNNTKLNIENSTNSDLEITTTVAQLTTSSFPDEQNEVNYTSDASSLSLVKQSTTTVTQSTSNPSPLKHNEVNYTSDASFMSLVKQSTTTLTQPSTGSSLQEHNKTNDMLDAPSMPLIKQSITTLTQPTSGPSPQKHNETNYMSDASSVPLFKISSNDNNSSMVVSPPPNPLSVEELQNLLELNRNEVKRQQPQEEAVTMAFIAPSSSTSSNSSDNGISTTGEISIKDEETNDNDPPLEALADSFGGESADEQGDSWLANAKPNGLYFLLDWNSFLSVGEEDKNPIRIRFQPRVGNPRNFQPIRVP